MIDLVGNVILGMVSLNLAYASGLVMFGAEVPRWGINR